jgi:hypothetical protein
MSRGGSGAAELTAAALFVNVSARISMGDTPLDTRCRMRCASKSTAAQHAILAHVRDGLGLARTGPRHDQHGADSALDRRTLPVVQPACVRAKAASSAGRGGGVVGGCGCGDDDRARRRYALRRALRARGRRVLREAADRAGADNARGLEAPAAMASADLRAAPRRKKRQVARRHTLKLPCGSGSHPAGRAASPERRMACAVAAGGR